MRNCNVQGLRQVDFKSFIFLPPQILISEDSELFHLKIKTFGWIQNIETSNYVN